MALIVTGPTTISTDDPAMYVAAEKAIDFPTQKDENAVRTLPPSCAVSLTGRSKQLRLTAAC